jgi:hypothetical protein
VILPFPVRGPQLAPKAAQWGKENEQIPLVHILLPLCRISIHDKLNNVLSWRVMLTTNCEDNVVHDLHPTTTFGLPTGPSDRQPQTWHPKLRWT